MVGVSIQPVKRCPVRRAGPRVASYPAAVGQPVSDGLGGLWVPETGPAASYPHPPVVLQYS
jgi:hypothetical protein